MAEAAVPIDIDEVVRETEKAKLFKTANGEIWIPKSQIIDEGDDIIMIPEWLAREKELV